MSRTLLTLGALLTALIFPAAAAAHGGDRNRDRIPDRWEQQHQLSLKVKQTRRDQDHDGLNNLAEYRSHTDPRDADSDDDGIGDNAENAGTIASFTGGVLTINLGKGGTLVGAVTGDTDIECHGATATAAGGGGDDQGDGDHGDQGDQGDQGYGGHGDQGDQGDGDDGDDGGNCGAEALTAGRQVQQAELKARNGEAVFEGLELGA